MAFKYVVNGGCVYCGACISECPARAIRLTPAGAVIDSDKCVGCGVCFENCYAEAIERVDVLEDTSERKSDDQLRDERRSCH